MTIAPKLRRFLEQHGVGYELIQHQPTMTSMRTAEVSHISGDKIAKAIVLHDGEGLAMAVVSASRRVRLTDLQTDIDRPVTLASEDEIASVFDDCIRGAIPPVGPCYGVNVIVDDSIDQLSDVYFEGGDHETLVHLAAADFAKLNSLSRRGNFTI